MLNWQNNKSNVYYSIAISKFKRGNSLWKLHILEILEKS